MTLFSPACRQFDPASLRGCQAGDWLRVPRDCTGCVRYDALDDPPKTLTDQWDAWHLGQRDEHSRPNHV
jgi:hypothetical protein